MIEYWCSDEYGLQRTLAQGTISQERGSGCTYLRTGQ
jgi:hypothetical protein